MKHITSQMRHLSQLILILNTVGVLSTIRCPTNETEWNTRSKNKTCKTSGVYHCLLVEVRKTRKEKCIERTTKLNEYCPIFTHDFHLHWKICNTTNCPKNPFKSDEVYKYPVCFGNIENEKETENEKARSKNKVFPFVISIPLGIVILVAVIVVIACKIYKGRQRTQDGTSGNEAGVSELENLIKNNASPEDEHIRVGIHLLNDGNILYVVGKLGNSVSTSGKKIADAFAESNNMISEYYNYLDITKDFFEPPTKKHSLFH
ncbi:uncharacterized protein LOC134263654 [Saccostrea cucullata]|uniref:uncharacterized protein LOC134263654 n=1 Tax=Saccostrea cuccullata TaxID=36930 RepID=UPI002ED11D91